MNALNYSASAKLLLFGEYLVLRGASALVIPLRFRQNLSVKSGITDHISWYSYENGNLWFNASFNPDFSIIETSDSQKAGIVQKLLLFIRKQNPGLKIEGKEFRFDIDFNRHFGLGTSSTLCSLLSQWAHIDPYLLQKQVFGGSGFDIAAATAGEPFIYQIQFQKNSVKRVIKSVSIHKNIADKLLFAYTGKKQNSIKEVISFNKLEVPASSIEKMNSLVIRAAGCSNLEEFEDVINKSEEMLSVILGKNPVKNSQFPDYPFSVKSLGAWGGDFVMATFRDQSTAIDYFRSKKMNPVFVYPEVVKL